ncbi:MAG: Mrp/NBP35 family ATP-binding protein [Candidatus Diapherotrites archaeon]|nr:Mrp/NBP35 family ATP-binding protein [Candidatus Diapherotrites archaeon]
MAEEMGTLNSGQVRLWQQRQRILQNLATVRHRIAVMSGKGGVGKTTVCINLAVLAGEGSKVGVVDCDIDCPNVNPFLGINDRLMVEGEKTILPVEKHGVKAVSMAGLQETPDTAIMWRGPLIANMLAQFLENTRFGELDYLFFDTPPGTSDSCLSLVQNAGLSGAIVVSTPQKVALADALKTTRMCQQLHVPVLGLVENMSGEVFGSGSVQAVAEKEGLAFLGSVKLDKKNSELAEDGIPAVTKNPSVRKEFEKILENMKKALESGKN